MFAAMKIYTSYIAKKAALEKEGIVCISICAIPPSDIDIPNLASVAPSKGILYEYKNNPDKERYMQRYKKEILCAYQTKEQCQWLIDTIKFISDGKDVALCCYEKPQDFCHRHILADYLNEMLDLDITEYIFHDKPESNSFALF